MAPIKNWRQARLAFDYRVMMAMAGSSRRLRIEAFATQHDLEKRRRAITDQKHGGSAGYYLVHYHMASLVGRGTYHDGFDIAFDLVSKGTYPEENAQNTVNAGGITATCVSRPLPWSPHFLPGVGTIRLGSIWRGADHTLLGHVVIHVARLLNWDEPVEASYGGWNRDAVEWWRNNLGAKPIAPGLDYPSLPVEVTHGVTASRLSSDLAAMEGLTMDTHSRDFLVIKASATRPNLRTHSRDILIL